MPQIRSTPMAVLILAGTLLASPSWGATVGHPVAGFLTHRRRQDLAPGPVRQVAKPEASPGHQGRLRDRSERLPLIPPPLANPSGSRASKFRGSFYVLLGHEPTTSLHPRRRCPGRGHLPNPPKPFPPSARRGARRDHRRRPGTGPAPLQSPLLWLHVRLEPSPPFARRRQRAPTLAIHGLRQFQHRPGDQPPPWLERQDLVATVPGDRHQQRGGGADRETEVPARDTASKRDLSHGLRIGRESTSPGP